MVIIGGIIQEKTKMYGGKGFHLQQLKAGGFLIPETIYCDNLNPNVDLQRKYIVRSSAAAEDSIETTAAGKYTSLLNISGKNIAKAIAEVRAMYSTGGIVIQPDLTETMKYSGVLYTNLNGSLLISIGKKNAVQEIVQGNPAATEIYFTQGKYAFKGEIPDIQIIDAITKTGYTVEQYFGRPMDIEFAVLENNLIILLQARPLPNPTEISLKEHEKRKIKSIMQHIKKQGIDEVIFGVGNYREILGDSKATPLSVTTFNYIFSGDGETKLGAVQLGRNELGYELSHEIYPWVVQLGGKVYYNFTGDLLQFRPQGITLQQMIALANNLYLPLIRGNPDQLNYPELQLYVQFPEQAKIAGIEEEPFNELVKKNMLAIDELVIPKLAPKKRIIKQDQTLDDLLSEVTTTIESIRIESAKDYVKAARLAFFALEKLRMDLLELSLTDKCSFESLTTLYGTSEAAKLRDALAYDESIASFELPETNDFFYLGSFELTLERGFPPKRHFKRGREIANTAIKKTTEIARTVLEYREKMKFFLLRDYDYLRQLYLEIAKLSQMGNDFFMLNLCDLSKALKEPTLAFYRVEIQQKMYGRNLFEDPIFENDLEQKSTVLYKKKTQLIFGNITQIIDGITGKNICIVNAVDQTVLISPETEVVFVPDNIRPGSHLFTILSDYGIPVISMPTEELKNIENKKIQIIKEGDNVRINYN